MSTTTSQIDAALAGLMAMRQRLNQGWCQNAEARDAIGMEVRPRHPSAVAWDISGAAVAADLMDKRDNMKQHVIGTISDLIGTWNWPRWNDAPERTKAEVLAVLDKAIAWIAP